MFPACRPIELAVVDFQNVANANTTGYKNVETDFSSLVDQISNGNADFGGVSTNQVSLNGLQGNVISTSTATDLAVQGAGFSVVSNSSGTIYLTRNGPSHPTPQETSSTAPATT